MRALLTCIGIIGIILLHSLAFTAATVPLMPEICDNALDDDGDNLVDLNDPDCQCAPVEPISLIPNPSFEDKTCCPNNRSELHCAETWIQASTPTTDYLHSCGWMGWDNLPPPLPFPDGMACVGFRNGRFGGDDPVPNWKEYAGACLRAPLRKGIAYRFEFYIGFTHADNSPPTNVVFFGTPDCRNLPFGNGDQSFGCPTNGPGWKRLGAVFVSTGARTWKKTQIEVTPTEDMHAIAIGPDCPQLNWNTDLYYFFDNLVLAEQSAFEFDIRPQAHPCSDQFTLAIPDYDTLTYQWYKDGVALIGETKAQLQVKTGEGNYVVRMIGNSECMVSKAYRHSIPVVNSIREVHICPGENYLFHNKAVAQSGVYQDTLKNAFNCDSIVQINLFVDSILTDTVRAKIFPGENFPVGSKRYADQGQYTVPLQSIYGCDSLVWLDLRHYQVFIPNAFSPNLDGVNDLFVILGGPDLVRIQNLQIFDRWGAQVFSVSDIPPNDASLGWDGNRKGQPADNGVYLYIATLEMDDGAARQVSGSMTLIR